MPHQMKAYGRDACYQRAAGRREKAGSATTQGKDRHAKGYSEYCREKRD
jgi:hypothetical protein